MRIALQSVRGANSRGGHSIRAGPEARSLHQASSTRDVHGTADVDRPRGPSTSGRQGVDVQQHRGHLYAKAAGLPDVPAQPGAVHDLGGVGSHRYV